MEMIPPSDMQIMFRDGPVPVLMLRGEFDLAVYERFNACLADLVATRPTELTVDMADVTFFDSKSLSALLHARRKLQEHGGSLVIAKPSPVVRRVLEITDLARTFEVSSTRRDGDSP
jgi:anti-anti-sigma factor